MTIERGLGRGSITPHNLMAIGTPLEERDEAIRRGLTYPLSGIPDEEALSDIGLVRELLDDPNPMTDNRRITIYRR